MKMATSLQVSALIATNVIENALVKDLEKLERLCWTSLAARRQSCDNKLFNFAKTLIPDVDFVILRPSILTQNDLWIQYGFENGSPYTKNSLRALWFYPMRLT